MNYPHFSLPTVQTPGLLTPQAPQYSAPQQQYPVGQGLFTQQARQLGHYKPWAPYATPTPPPAPAGGSSSSGGNSLGSIAGLLGLLGVGAASNGGLGPALNGIVKSIGGLLGKGSSLPVGGGVGIQDPYSGGFTPSTPDVPMPDMSDVGDTYNGTTDYGDGSGYTDYGGFNAAGGAAAGGGGEGGGGGTGGDGGLLGATSGSSPSLGQVGNGALNALNIYNGLQKGGLSGYGGAALSGASLANQAGASIPYVGPLGNALGVYNGIQQGGVKGYAGAAANAAALYGAASNAVVAGGGSALAGSGAASAVAPYLGPIMAAYALKSFGDNQTAHMTDYDVVDPVTGQRIVGNNPMMYDSLLSVNGKSGIQTLEDQKNLTANMTPTQLKQYQNQQNKDQGMGTGH